MKLSPAGEELIKSFEALRLSAYLPTPTDRWTIGWGHTRTARPGMTITEAEAEALLRADVAPAEAAVNAMGLTLSPSAFDALVSLVFNCGPGAISPTSTIGRALRRRDWRAAWAAFTLWTATPNAQLGQARRRTAEMALFLKERPLSS